MVQFKVNVEGLGANVNALKHDWTISSGSPHQIWDFSFASNPASHKTIPGLGCFGKMSFFLYVHGTVLNF